MINIEVHLDKREILSVSWHDNASARRQKAGGRRQEAEGFYEYCLYSKPFIAVAKAIRIKLNTETKTRQPFP